MPFPVQGYGFAAISVYLKRGDLGFIHPEKMTIVGHADQLRKNWPVIEESEVDAEKLYEEALAFLEWCGSA